MRNGAPCEMGISSPLAASPPASTSAWRWWPTSLGEAVARSIQLSLEYDPNPPFASGHPDRAATETLAEVAPRYQERRADFRKGIERLVTEGWGSAIGTFRRVRANTTKSG